MQQRDKGGERRSIEESHASQQLGGIKICKHRGSPPLLMLKLLLVSSNSSYCGIHIKFLSRASQQQQQNNLPVHSRVTIRNPSVFSLSLSRCHGCVIQLVRTVCVSRRSKQQLRVSFRRAGAILTHTIDNTKDEEEEGRETLEKNDYTFSIRAHLWPENAPRMCLSLLKRSRISDTFPPSPAPRGDVMQLRTIQISKY